MSTELIMVIDDDDDIRETLSEWLEMQGFRVVMAANGAEALRELRNMADPPAAILLDLMMPVMDGYAFLEERARDAAVAAIPVAILTAGRADAARIVGRPRVIGKPIDPTGLLGILGELGAEPARDRA